MAEVVNPEMLRVAREAVGLTQTELAKRISITQGTLCKYEKGVLGVSDKDLQSFVRELGLPEAFFYQQRSVAALGSRCLYFRKRSSTTVKDLRRIEAILNIFVCQLDRLVSHVEIETDGEFLTMDVNEVRPPEFVAEAVRGAWNVPMGPIRNVTATIENAGAIIYKWDFGTTKLDAVSVMAGKRPVIFVNSKISGDRSRLTLLHEVGHLVMHRVPNEAMEEQANAFATAILLPAAEIRQFLRKPTLGKLVDLKEEWGVSMQALVRRARDLGVITERKYRSLNIEISRAGWKLNEPGEVPSEEPTVLRDIVNLQLEEHGFTLESLADFAFTSVQKLQHITGANRKSIVAAERGLRIVGGC